MSVPPEEEDTREIIHGLAANGKTSCLPDPPAETPPAHRVPAPYQVTPSSVENFHHSKQEGSLVDGLGNPNGEAETPREYIRQLGEEGWHGGGFQRY